MYRLIKIFISPIIRAIWIRKVEGIENIPKKGKIIIASNHESYFDFLCFAAVCPRPVYYLAGEVFFKKWWWRPLMKMTNQIRVDRTSNNTSDSINKALEVLDQGKAFGIFPEGTRSGDGKLQKAFTGVARIALQAKCMVVPVGMIGTYEIMSRHDKHPHLNKCEIKIGQPINLESYFGKENIKETLELITHKIIMPQLAQLTDEEYNY